MKKHSAVTCRAFAAILFILIFGRGLPAQQAPGRGGGVRVKTAAGQTKEVVLYEGSYALVIGNSRYADGWDALPGVTSDISAVRDILERHGFKVEVAENLNSRQFDERMRQFIDAYGYQRNNRLLVYFAGHGHTLTSTGDERELGYVVPTDAPHPSRDELNFRRRAVSMDAIQTYAKQIQAKHALFIFDSCFSGKLVSRNAVTAPPFIQESVAYAVRQFITAGAANQIVPDESIFRRALVRGLEGEADRNHDSYMTGTELAVYLKEKVTNYTDRRQTPQYGTINDIYLDRGDFVFGMPVPVAATGPKPSAGAAETLLSSYRRWLNLYDSSDYATVVREADAELSRNPNNALALRARSAAYYLLNEPEKGKQDVEAAARLLTSAGNAEEHEARCYAKWRLGRADEAVSDCTRAISLDLRYKFAYLNRGNAYKDKREYDRAMGAIKSVTQYRHHQA